MVLGLLSVLLFNILSRYPKVTEKFYTEFVYNIIRKIYSVSLYYVPFALMYVFASAILFLIVRYFYKKYRKESKSYGLMMFLNFVGWLVVAFYWLWGFNYARADFTERVGLKVSIPDSSFLYDELKLVDSVLIAKRALISEIDTIALDVNFLPANFQNIIRESQRQVIRHFGEPVLARAKIRQLLPKGNLLRLKTAGIYFPFVLEGHIDGGLHPIEKPYVMAHEMAHANAFTDEGVCNFIGLLTCINSKNDFVEYSGWLEYQGYLYRALRRNYPEVLKAKAYQRPIIVETDLKSIVETLSQYPDIFPRFRDFFYNGYLKAQGVKSGIKSYSEIVRLVHSFGLQNGGLLLE